MADYSSSNENNSTYDETVENEYNDSNSSGNKEDNKDYQSNNNDNIIDVDNDFGGDLKAAIASANNGDTVQIGGSTYYTNGLVIDKDITIDGQQGSTIDGGGTSESVLKLTSQASGATIQDLKVTNGNNGIFGNGATNVTLENLEVSNIGLDQTKRQGMNNTGVILNNADGSTFKNSKIYDVGRKGVGIGDTDGAVISNLKVQNVNLAAQHSQSHDASGIKLYNTNNVEIKNNYLSDVNAFGIWNDTTNGTKIEGNEVSNVGEDFLAPGFNQNVNIAGIYNEKSSNSTVKYNKGTAVDDFLVFKATDFSTKTMDFGENDFPSYELGSTDYWVNKEAEKQIATTENPGDANFGLFSDQYYGQANIG